MDRETNLPDAGPSTPAAATLPALMRAALAAHDGPALRSPARDDPDALSYPELRGAVSEIGRGLIALGIGPGDRVAILAGTRAEWTLADLGAQWAGAIVVPIYHTNSAEECEYVLHHSGARAVLCENASDLAKVDSVRDRCPELEHRVLLTGPADGATGVDALRERGRELDESVLEERSAQVQPDDIATIVYTSGTTGPPKGCMLTHANLLATVDLYRERLGLGADMSAYMFLPLAHALARVTELVVLSVGGTIIFWRGDPKRIVEELAEASPTHFPSVPRVFEKVHTAIFGGVEEQSRVRRTVFRWALAEGARARAREEAGRAAGPIARRRHDLADRLVLSKVRAAFGDGLRVGLTGAAPVSREILEFFDACGVLVLEGYGLTETCAASTLNTAEEHRFGTVGRPLPGVEIKVADDGELLISGPNVFAGYYRDEQATEETMSDGWLRTGDLGAVDADGFVQITGRKKDLIITSSGKNISPTNVEDLLRETRWISQAIVAGDNRSYLVALLTIDPDEAPKLAEKVGAPTSDLADLSRHPGVRAELQACVDEANSRLARIEQVKRFTILDHDLTQAAGELTPTMKLKRGVVNERYADLVEELYA
jgi:long-chain acyl-CoA synthetase